MQALTENSSPLVVTVNVLQHPGHHSDVLHLSAALPQSVDPASQLVSSGLVGGVHAGHHSLQLHQGVAFALSSPHDGNIPALRRGLRVLLGVASEVQGWSDCDVGEAGGSWSCSKHCHNTGPRNLRKGSSQLNLVLLMPCNYHDTHVKALSGLHNHGTSTSKIAHLKRLCQVAVLVQRLVISPSNARHIRLHHRLPTPYRSVHVVAHHCVGGHGQIPGVDSKRHHQLHPRGEQSAPVRIQDGRASEGNCRCGQAGNLKRGAGALRAAVQALVGLVEEDGRGRGHLQQVLTDPRHTQGVVLHDCHSCGPGPPRPGAEHGDAAITSGPGFVLCTRGLLPNHNINRELHGPQLEEHTIKGRLRHGVQHKLQIL
mmetsp:Transcript_26761/g.59073  ORF Transcript_26761/g.59073 Transcript_26761/m.59073 type:complete len:370 (-) Transcript_26761:1397-2506(-)